MGEPPHLLVVDDHREIRDALAKYLTKHDYRVSSATHTIDGSGYRTNFEVRKELIP